MKTMKLKLLLFVLALLPLRGNTQVANLDFETWINPIDSGTNSNNRPDNWFFLTPGLTEPSVFSMFYHSPATDAQNGNYAFKLSTWYYYAKDLAVLSQPYTSRVSTLKGFYKYVENSIDSLTNTITDVAQISVFMTKWNPVTMHRDTVGTGILDLNAAASYTSFTTHVTYINQTILPDSIHILLDPSLVRRGPNSNDYIATDDGIASFLTVDNLSLTDEAVAGMIEASDRFRVYPNPVTDFITIEHFTGQVKLSDLNGKFIHEQNLESNPVLSLDQLDAGVYLLQLNAGDFIQNVRIIKK